MRRIRSEAETDFEDRLRAHLTAKAEGIEVPARRLEITPHPTPPRSRAIATSLATIAVLVSVIGVSVASRGPGPREDFSELALPETASLFTQPSRAAESRTTFEWQRAPGVQATQLFEAEDGTILAFGPADVVTNQGLGVWTHRPDQGWTGPRPVAGLAYEAKSIHVDEGIVALAYGSPWAFQFPELAGGTLLVSGDGQQWSEQLIPMVVDPPHARAELIVAGAGRVLLRTRERSPGAAEAWEAVGADYVNSAFSFDVLDDDTGAASVVVTDLDLAVATFSTSALLRQREPAFERFWLTSDYQNWTEVVMPDLGTSIEHWTGFHDGSHYVVTATATDRTSYFLTSPDLRIWELSGVSQDLYDVRPSQSGGYLASLEGASPPRLFTSSDLSEWAPITADDASQPDATSTDAFDQGGLGTAVVYTNSQGGPGELILGDIPDTLVYIERSEKRITVIRRDGTVPVTLEYDRYEPNPGVRYDSVSDALVLNNPQTGEELIRLAASDVLSAIHAADAEVGYDSSMLFAANQEPWRLFDLTAEIGAEGPVTDVLVSNDRVFVAFGPGPGAAPAQVWEGRPVAGR